MISVIIPVYNVEDYLRRCLDSIINQTYRDLEIICVNDGSSDNSEAILDDYKMKDQRITVITQDNKGLSAARNEGLKYAKGSEIVFIDSDDWIDLNMLKVMSDAMKEYNVDIVCVKERVVSELMKSNDALLESGGIKVNFTPNAVDALFKIKVSNFAWGKLIKRHIVDGINPLFAPGRRYEDIASMYKVFDCANGVVSIENPMYYYFQRSTSITGKRIEKDITDKFLSLEEMKEYVFRNESKYWNFYRCVKYFGLMSDLFKMSDISNEKRNKYIDIIYSNVNNLSVPIWQYGFDLSTIKILLLKYRIADIMLRYRHKNGKNITKD